MKKIRYALLTGGLSAAMVITAVLPACAEETMVPLPETEIAESEQQFAETAVEEIVETLIETESNNEIVETEVIEDSSETETESVVEETEETKALEESQDPVEAFVARLYKVILNRNPDPSGLKAWTNVLKSGKEQGAKVAQGFVDSDELKNRNLSDDAYIRALYKAFFDREADESGLAAWKKVLNSGLSRMHVFRGFAESDEFTKICSRYGIIRGFADLKAPMDQNEGITKFIYRCYEVFLGRKPDEKGLNEWASQLLNGQNNAKEVAYGFVMSNEFQGKKLSDSDYVQTMYQGLFDRNADGEGLAAWVAKLEAGNSRESIFYGFADSQEFRKLASSFGLNGDWTGTPVIYKMDKEAFIQCLMDNRSTWEMSKSEATNYSGYFDPGYSMVDMDLDGQPELIVAPAGGSMHNAPVMIYRVQDNKVVPIKNTSSGGNEMQDLALYYNSAENRYVYVDKRLHRSGVYALYESVCEMNCSGNVVNEEGKFEYAKEDFGRTGNYTYSYYIGTQKVSQSQYDNAYNSYFSGMRNTNMKRGFVPYKTWKNYSVSSKKTALSKLYDEFSYQK